MLSLFPFLLSPYWACGRAGQRRAVWAGAEGGRESWRRSASTRRGRKGRGAVRREEEAERETS